MSKASEEQMRNRAIRRSEKAIGAYLWRINCAVKALQAESKWFWQGSGSECLHSEAQCSIAQFFGANPSGIPPGCHVADAVHSALKREHSDLEPGGHEIVRLMDIFLKLRNPSYLRVNVAVADPKLGRPLVFLHRRSELEFGQVDEVGALVRRSDVEKGGLPVFDRLNDGRGLIALFARVKYAAAAVGHGGLVNRRVVFSVWIRQQSPVPSHVTSEVEEVLPQPDARPDAEIAFAEGDESRHLHDEFGGEMVRLKSVEIQEFS